MTDDEKKRIEEIYFTILYTTFYIKTASNEAIETLIKETKAKIDMV